MTTLIAQDRSSKNHAARPARSPRVAGGTAHVRGKEGSVSPTEPASFVERAAAAVATVDAESYAQYKRLRWESFAEEADRRDEVLRYMKERYGLTPNKQ